MDDGERVRGQRKSDGGALGLVKARVHKLQLGRVREFGFGRAQANVPELTEPIVAGVARFGQSGQRTLHRRLIVSRVNANGRTVLIGRQRFAERHIDFAGSHSGEDTPAVLGGLRPGRGQADRRSDR